MNPLLVTLECLKIMNLLDPKYVVQVDQNSSFPRRCKVFYLILLKIFGMGGTNPSGCWGPKKR